MAEEQDYSGYGATGYVPITKWNYVPFYKKHSFITGNGVVPSNQVANLVTSPSFTEFWSGGASQADNTSLIRVKNASRDADAIRRSGSGKYNVDFQPKPNPFPARPTPPAGIRPIKWANNLPELFDPSLLGMSPEQVWHEGGFRPDKFTDLWPQLSAEEQAWWDEAIRGKGGYNDKYLKHGHIEGANSNVPSILQNKAGALTRPDRLRLSSMLYHTPDTGFERWVNASSPQNLIGVSRELSESGMSSRSDFKPQNSTLRVKRTLPIQLLTTTNPDVALSVAPSMKLLDEYQLQRMMEGAIDNHHMEKFDPLKFDPRKAKIGPLNVTPFLDVPKQEVPAVAIPSDVQRAEMQAGNVRNVGYMKPHGHGGVETIVYGPPDKYAQWRARGMQALNIGGKVLLGAGIVGETMNTPSRIQGYYENALREDPNWRPDISDKIGMSFAAGAENALNFGTMGFWDQKERIYEDMSSGAGYGKGYYGTMIPPAGATSVHYNPQSRYERTGVSFNHLYPKAP